MERSLEKEIGTHSSILARGIPWREEPGGRLSMGSQRVGFNFHQRRLKQQQQQRTKTYNAKQALTYLILYLILCDLFNLIYIIYLLLILYDLFNFTGTYLFNFI